MFNNETEHQVAPFNATGDDMGVEVLITELNYHFHFIPKPQREAHSRPIGVIEKISEKLSNKAYCPIVLKSSINVCSYETLMSRNKIGKIY